MGEWLAGERAPDLEEVLHSGVRDGLSENGRQVLKNVGQRPLTPALHATLSQSLAGYALHAARPIVEAHQGFLVYAGGDDVLAFVSIENALPLLLDLRAAFSGHRSSNGSIDLAASPTGFVHEENRIRTTLGPSATASAGLAVAHYKTPLGLVLDTAYRMEEQAKDAPGKDAWAAAVMKRSGERTKTRLPFRPAGLDHPEGSIGVLSGVVQDLKERDISPVFARQLRRELAPLVGQDGTFGEGMTEGSEILKGELTRLLKRRDVDSDWAEKTAHMLERLYVSTESNVDNFLSALSTALFLIKET
jgi:CRISPR-associated protein Cmr2